MQRVEALSDLFHARQTLAEPVGLVPTMGFLHEGHLALVRAAKAGCASVVVSIFVNPTQFGPNEDLAAYPRDLPRDLRLLAEAGADLTWTPTPVVMYPPGFQTWVTVSDLTVPLEGAVRPGHFKGVTTVVAKLFNAVRPHKAYFGQKDAQQAAVIRRMAHDLSYPIEVIVYPTVREPDGLAMSSRNTFLDPEQRRAARVLFRSLQAGSEAFDAGVRDAARLKQAVMDVLNTEPLARIQYVSTADPETLQELEQIQDRVLVSMAVSIGKTRLIDNMVYPTRKSSAREP
jgi:pantoate--beta-alanine ligase